MVEDLWGSNLEGIELSRGEYDGKSGEIGRGLMGLGEDNWSLCRGRLRSLDIGSESLKDAQGTHCRGEMTGLGKNSQVGTAGGTLVLDDMWMYLSENEEFNNFGNEEALFWQETNIPYAVWTADSTRVLSLKTYPSEALKNNGSLYAHVFFARSCYPPDPKDPKYQPLAAFGLTHLVVIYLPKLKADKKKSLLRGNRRC